MALRRSMGLPGLPPLPLPPPLPPLLLAGLAALLLAEPAAAGLKLMGAPVKLTVSQGQPVKLNCSVEGMEEPEIHLKSVERSDAGRYWCQVEDGGEMETSQPVWLTVEGVPFFTVEPKDLAVPPNAPFQLSCEAVGPPEPVTIVWWRGGTKVGGPAPSPSVLNVTGVTQSTVFSCEAHNLKGLASSRPATVRLQALPAAPFNITVTKLSSSNASVAWTPGADGRALLQSCTVQVTQAPGGWEVLAVVVPVPPFTCLLRDLAPATNYSLRVRCANALGPSPYADWVPFRTKGLAPASAPQNLHAIRTARRGGSCGSPPKPRWERGLTKWPNPSSSCGHSGLPGIGSGLGWVEVGQAWLPKPRQLAGGGGYVSMVPMGVERSWGRVDPAPWAPTLWLRCPAALVHALRGL